MSPLMGSVVYAAKGGSDFSARGKSKHEVIRFCQVRKYCNSPEEDNTATPKP